MLKSIERFWLVERPVFICKVAKYEIWSFQEKEKKILYLV